MDETKPLNAVVRVGRLWHQPKIYAMVSVDKVEASMALEDLVRIVVDEVEKAHEAQAAQGPPVLLMTRQGLRKRLGQLGIKELVEKVAQDVVDELKETTKYAV